MTIIAGKVTVSHGCSIIAADAGLWGSIMKWMTVFIYFVISFPVIAFCTIIINVKSSQDILQGISKLDYLMKASEF